MKMEIFIVNLTTNTFFRCYMKNKIDEEYNNAKLLELLTPPDKKDKYSHWSREDKIVFCPKHLYEYVEKHYGEIYV